MTQRPTHGLRRTSPEGEDFIGTCILCGRKGLSMFAAWEPCENVSEMHDDDALVNLIKDEDSAQ